MRNPSASTKPSRNATPVPPLNVADARQDFGAEQFEPAHHALDVARPRIGERQVDHSGADLRAAAPELLDDPVRPATEADRQNSADIRRSSLAGNVAGHVR